MYKIKTNNTLHCPTKTTVLQRLSPKPSRTPLKGLIKPIKTRCEEIKTEIRLKEKRMHCKNELNMTLLNTVNKSQCTPTPIMKK